MTTQATANPSNIIDGLYAPTCCSPGAGPRASRRRIPRMDRCTTWRVDGLRKAAWPPGPGHACDCGHPLQGDPLATRGIHGEPEIL